MKHISIFTIFFIVITILKLITANEDPRCNPQELEQYSQEYETCHQKAFVDGKFFFMQSRSLQNWFHEIKINFKE